MVDSKVVVVGNDKKNKATTATSTTTTSTKSMISSLFSVSCGATIFMILYISLACINLYYLMYPLSRYDISQYNQFVKPLWGGSGRKDNSDNDTEEMHLRIYLSTKSIFDLKSFFANDFSTSTENNDDDENDNTTTKKSIPASSQLLWNQKLDLPAFSKSFLLTSLSNCDNGKKNHNECLNNNNINDTSYQFANTWLDHAEQMAIGRGEGGVLSTLTSGAGHGIESTSALLTLYQWITEQIHSTLILLKLKHNNDTNESLDTMKTKLGILNRTIITLPKNSPMWNTLRSNATLYLHVLLLRRDKSDDKKSYVWPPTSLEEANNAVRYATSTRSILLGKVNMIKYEPPHHIEKPKRILLNDLLYWYNKYIKYSKEMPPWIMEIWKPKEYNDYKYSLELKSRNAGYPYWKPEVAIKYINDNLHYPIELVHLSGMQLVQTNKNQHHPTGIAFMPAMHVDEMGMTSEKYIPVNETITSLPLRISFDRSDLEHYTVRTTATSGGMSPARWRLLSHLSDAIEKQKQMGFEQSDIDDVKRLIADTNITLLTITMLASALHLLFEFLTFKNEVSFWKKNTDLTGLSVRSLFLDMIGQTIVLLFLIEENSSLLTTIPSGIGCLIALWKCQRGAGLQFVRTRSNHRIAWWNWLPSLFGYELRATRLEARLNKTESDDPHEAKKDKLIAMTIEADKIATKYLGAVLLPLAGGYALYSLIYKEHSGWYSWGVTSAASAVYALGFVLMTPQLFLNWKLKSVAHLPWRVLIYKSLNTFIDDLFSFIIRMPTMARISCFRDDVVFFIYLYQRWLYPVDKSRPMEGGGEYTTITEHADGKTAPEMVEDKKRRKKNQ